jgi:hypothetical protein
MNDVPDDLKEAFASLVEAQEELAAIFEWIEEQHPHEMQRVTELRSEIPQLRDAIVDLIRLHGKTVDYLGHQIKVTTWNKDSVDEAELLERARERGDINRLFELGFIKYSVEAKQLARLPGDLRAVYGQFIESVPQTPRVSLPKELKEL